MDYRPILSGQRKDPLAIAIRGALTIASVPYRCAVAIRNHRYDTGALEIHNCGVPVICVGNLTTGGTGKTPIVCFLARWFRQHGRRVSIVSRGYGRGDHDSNDEALELHDRLPDVPHVQDVDRVEAARIAVEELEAELILMDDGFQHRRLHRDLNIVVIDATCPLGYGHLLPRGTLREPMTALARANAAIITRCDAVRQQDLDDIEAQIRHFAPNVPIERTIHQAASLLEYPQREVPIDELRGCNVAAVSAIGNPAAFERSLADCGANVVDARRLSDHDAFEPDTVRQLQRWVEGLGPEIDRVVCTHKDLVKLKTDRLGGHPLSALLIELKFRSDGGGLEKLLVEKLSELEARR